MVSGGTDSTPDQKGVGITEAKKENLFFLLDFFSISASYVSFCSILHVNRVFRHECEYGHPLFHLEKYYRHVN